MLEARNEALNINPPYADEHITEHGSDWYYTVCAVMGVSALAMAFMARGVLRANRIFYYINIAIVATACIAYYTMGSDLGYTAVNVEFQRSDPSVSGTNRQVFYARYIDWFITTPLIILDLTLLAGLHWMNILFVVFLDWVMVISGLLGALTSTRYKWGYFFAGCVAFLAIVWEIAWAARLNARAIGADVGRLHLGISAWILFLWALYPIAWGLSEGGNVIHPDSEAVFYGVLDILSKPVFCFWLLFGHRNIAMDRLGLAGRQRASVNTGAV